MSRKCNEGVTHQHQMDNLPLERAPCGCAITNRKSRSRQRSRSNRRPPSGIGVMCLDNVLQDNGTEKNPNYGGEDECHNCGEPLMLLSDDDDNTELCCKTISWLWYSPNVSEGVAPGSEVVITPELTDAALLGLHSRLCRGRGAGDHVVLMSGGTGRRDASA
uniref:Uncharacterized protein n=1 Tax=Trichogramma kaykai TaxID=54128 RepID=A0ABD2WBA3_9HYME